jgi:hypothetical protein
MPSKFIFALLLFSTSLFGQAGFRLHVRNASEVYAEQRRLVGTWCRQDFEGVRLAPGGWERYKALTKLKSNPESQTVLIVSRYQIEQHEVQSVSWDVDVTYFVVGRFERGGGYVADEHPETVTFRTKEIDGDIVVTDVDPVHPHLSKKAAIEWMKRELATTTSDVEKFHLASALKILEPATASRVAAQPAK